MSNAYSPSETKLLIEKYTDKPCLETVRQLSVQFNKPVKSIIAKLSKEGVYVTKGYVDKRGERPITKLELVSQIENIVRIPLEGLDKAPKGTLKNLLQALTSVSELLDSDLQELTRVQREMLQNKK